MGVVTYGRYFHLDKSLYHHEQRTQTLEQQLPFGVCLYQAQSKMEDKKSFLEWLMDLVWFLGQYQLFLYSNLKHFVQQLCCHAMNARLLICLSKQSEIGIKPNQTEIQTHNQTDTQTHNPNTETQTDIQQIHIYNTIYKPDLTETQTHIQYNTIYKPDLTETQTHIQYRLRPKHTYNTTNKPNQTETQTHMSTYHSKQYK